MRHDFVRVGVISIMLVLAPSLQSRAPGSDKLPREMLLSEGWLFQPDPLEIGDKKQWHDSAFDRSGWRAVAVPMAWDAYDIVMDGYEGVCWYAFQISAEYIDADAWQRLEFGRVNHRTTIWVNGQKAGENNIGYLPFEVPVSPFLTPGQPAWIVLRVENGARYDWLPGSTTVEWVQYGGLLEPVKLLTTPLTYISHATIRTEPGKQDAKIFADIEIQNVGQSSFAGRTRFAADGKTVDGEIQISPGASIRTTLELTLPEVQRWSPDVPRLYDAQIQLLDSDGEIDLITDRFGVRTIETKGQQILLNGSPLRICGVNRYDEMSAHGPVADEAAIRADLSAVKAMGANLIRVHYPQDPVHLRIADEIGLLFLEEVPLNWWRAPFHPKVPAEFENDKIIDLAELALERMIRRDCNHPSIVIWSVANECRTDDELGIRAMERLLRRAKELDPTRLVTYAANRSLEKNRAFALADLVAVNLYFGMWDGKVANDMGEIESRVHQPTRQRLAAIARHFRDKPLVLSEFGTMGIPGSRGDMRFSEDYQAAYVSAVWRAVEDVPEISGGIVWCWADYRHRRGFTNDYPAFFGPFGIVRLDRTPKKSHDALKAAWQAKGQAPSR